MGSLPAWSSTPTSASRWSARFGHSRGEYTPQKSMGSITFSSTVSVGSSWKNWNTTPTLRPRHSANLPSLMFPRFVPATHTSPLRGPVNPRDHVDQRRFAAARFADDGHKLAAIHLQVDAAQRREGTRRRHVRLLHPSQVDQAGTLLNRVASRCAPSRCTVCRRLSFVRRCYHRSLLSAWSGTCRQPTYTTGLGTRGRRSAYPPPAKAVCTSVRRSAPEVALRTARARPSHTTKSHRDSHAMPARARRLPRQTRGWRLRPPWGTGIRRCRSRCISPSPRRDAAA